MTREEVTIRRMNRDDLGLLLDDECKANLRTANVLYLVL